MKIVLSFLGGVALAGVLTWTTAPAQPPGNDDDPPPARERDRRPPRDDDERGGPGNERRGPREDRGHFRRGPDGPPPHPIHPLEKVLDADGNDSISAEEISHAVDALKKLDKNNDGKLTRDELRPDPPPRSRGPGRFGPPPPPCREHGERGGRYGRWERRPPPRDDFDDDDFDRPRRRPPPHRDEYDDEEPGRVDE